jgi:hypothetical protein
MAYAIQAFGQNNDCATSYVGDIVTGLFFTLGIQKKLPMT